MAYLRLPLAYLSPAILAVACSKPAPLPTPLDPSSVSAPPPSSSAAPPPPLTPATRQRLLDAIAAAIRAHYVYPDVGEQMVTALRDHAARASYDTLTDGDAFAAAVTTDLRAVSHDRHVMLEHAPPPPPNASPADQVAELRKSGYGFGVVERLSGDVAHVVIHEFGYVSETRAAIATAMSKVADASALIIDLRENHGGDPETVALVASYLFDSTPVHLNDMFWHDDGSTNQFWTLRDVAGARFGSKKPVFVLTSKTTFSAAEEFAYDLQCLKRATIVGETTAGGAHPVFPQRIDPWFTIRVPMGRAINPITKTNWEGVGVVPDVPVAADSALEEAHARALAASAPRGP